jgi:hypothetical protein
MNDDTRQQFETWWIKGRSEALLYRYHDGNYQEPYASEAWEAWQASRTAALEGAAAHFDGSDVMVYRSEVAAAIRALKEA